ncbi:hypothetical protein GE09DRAFT_1150230 [Coniochaeta sp. 2T2.1]|nr:hypothetical protein GE09DRAFT_1150230 [Coniochaeta sp. 2T2.1]
MLTMWKLRFDQLFASFSSAVILQSLFIQAFPTLCMTNVRRLRPCGFLGHNGSHQHQAELPRGNLPTSCNSTVSLCRPPLLPPALRVVIVVPEARR